MVSAVSDIGGGVGSRVVGSKDGDRGGGGTGGVLGASSLTSGSVSGSGSASASGDAGGGGVGTLSSSATCSEVKYWLMSLKYHPYSPLESFS